MNSTVRTRPVPAAEARGGGVPKVIVKSKPTPNSSSASNKTDVPKVITKSTSTTRSTAAQASNKPATGPSNLRSSNVSFVTTTKITNAKRTTATNQRSNTKEPAKVTPSTRHNAATSSSRQKVSIKSITEKDSEVPINSSTTASSQIEPPSLIKEQPSASSSASSTFSSTKSDAFHLLPRQLIFQGLVYEAIQILLDEKFLLCRIDQLGLVRTAALYGREWQCLIQKHQGSNTSEEQEEQSILDALNIIPELAMVDDEDVKMTQDIVGNVTRDNKPDLETILDSLRTSMDVVRHVILGMMKLNPNETLPQDAPSSFDYSWLEGGQALLRLGTCLQVTQQFDPAILFYHTSLYFLFRELGYVEEVLLQGSTLEESFFEKMVEWMEPRSNAHCLIGTVLTRMGDVYSLKQNLDLSWKAYRTAYEFCAQRVQYYFPQYQGSTQGLEVTKDDVDQSSAILALALTYKRIGAVYILQEQYSEAMSCFERTLELQTLCLGDMHVDIGRSLHDMGVAQRQTGFWESALKSYGKAHKIFEHQFGREHLDTVRTLHNIGGIYRRQKEYDKALICFREVLRVRRKLLGDKHPSVALVLVSIGSVLRHQGHLQEAYKYYHRAMK